MFWKLPENLPDLPMGQYWRRSFFGIGPMAPYLPKQDKERRPVDIFVKLVALSICLAIVGTFCGLLIIYSTAALGDHEVPSILEAAKELREYVTLILGAAVGSAFTAGLYEMKEKFTAQNDTEAGSQIDRLDDDGTCPTCGTVTYPEEIPETPLDEFNEEPEPNKPAF